MHRRPSDKRILQELPLHQWEAVEEVSLSPCGILACLLATAGSMVHVCRSGIAIVAPHYKPLRRMVSYLLHPMFTCQGSVGMLLPKLRLKTD